MTVEEMHKLKIQDVLCPQKTPSVFNRLLSWGWIDSNGRPLYYKYDTGRPYLTTEGR